MIEENKPDMRVRLGDLVGAHDLAERLQVSYNTVTAWDRGERGVDFPGALCRVNQGRVKLYWWPQIEHWFKNRVDRRR